MGGGWGSGIYSFSLTLSLSHLSFSQRLLLIFRDDNFGLLGGGVCVEETEEDEKKRSEEKRAKEAKEQGTKTRERRWRERVGCVAGAVLFGMSEAEGQKGREREREKDP